MSNTTKPEVKRIHQIIKLKPEHYEAYKECHAKVWPEVLQRIKSSHIEDYSISYDPSTNILFASFKYTGTNFEEDMEAIRQDAKTREWWKMTDGYQLSLNPGAVSSEMGGVNETPTWWKELEEVFYVA